ncbi:hypothetical protein [Spiroplasma endosymbiont of Aspidapion aeneum]|uniref:hypothetical protein n=1 Tax=Spiroplasma endosymbiont of Aspidapion aeneum TaxID=3066276 RepID=UPI00313D9A69
MNKLGSKTLIKGVIKFGTKNQKIKFWCLVSLLFTFIFLDLAVFILSVRYQIHNNNLSPLYSVLTAIGLIICSAITIFLYFLLLKWSKNWEEKWISENSLTWTKSKLCISSYAYLFIFSLISIPVLMIAIFIFIESDSSLLSISPIIFYMCSMIFVNFILFAIIFKIEKLIYNERFSPKKEKTYRIVTITLLVVLNIVGIIYLLTFSYYIYLSIKKCHDIKKQKPTILKLNKSV